MEEVDPLYLLVKEAISDLIKSGGLKLKIKKHIWGGNSLSLSLLIEMEGYILHASDITLHFHIPKLNGIVRSSGEELDIFPSPVIITSNID